MPPIYSREKLWETYKTLPEGIKEVLFSNEAAKAISDICEKNGLSEEEKSSVSEIVNRVLFRLLPVDDFQQALEEGGIKKEAAKKIAQEINRYIFSPVKQHLTAEKKTEKEIKSEEGIKKEPIEAEEEPSEEAEEQKPKASSAGDTYRESIE